MGIVLGGARELSDALCTETAEGASPLCSVVHWRADWIAACRTSSLALPRLAAKHPSIRFWEVDVTATEANKKLALEKVMMPSESARRGALPILRAGHKFPCLSVQEGPVLQPSRLFTGPAALTDLEAHLAGLECSLCEVHAASQGPPWRADGARQAAFEGGLSHSKPFASATPPVGGPQTQGGTASNIAADSYATGSHWWDASSGNAKEDSYATATSRERSSLGNAMEDSYATATSGEPASPGNAKEESYISARSAERASSGNAQEDSNEIASSKPRASSGDQLEAGTPTLAGLEAPRGRQYAGAPLGNRLDQDAARGVGDAATRSLGETLGGPSSPRMLGDANGAVRQQDVPLVGAAVPSSIKRILVEEEFAVHEGGKPLEAALDMVSLGGQGDGAAGVTASQPWRLLDRGAAQLKQELAAGVGKGRPLLLLWTEAALQAACDEAREVLREVAVSLPHVTLLEAPRKASAPNQILARGLGIRSLPTLHLYNEMKLCTKLVGSKISVTGIRAVLAALSSQPSICPTSISSPATQASTAISSPVGAIKHSVGSSPLQVSLKHAASLQLERSSGESPVGGSVSQSSAFRVEPTENPPRSASSFFSAGVPDVCPGRRMTSCESDGADNGQNRSTVSSGAKMPIKGGSVSQGTSGPLDATRETAAAGGSGMYDPPPKPTDGKDVTRKFPKGVGHFWYVS
eukprot:jgi/Botrbrau1/4193/Bobra.0044s0001.4